MSGYAWGIAAVESGMLPDTVTRFLIRAICSSFLRQQSRSRSAATIPSTDKFLASLTEGPIALMPEQANHQHYELPAEFFDYVLGPRRKYSCCDWPETVASLEDAEQIALQTTCERAALVDGQKVLELGCGWGSLSLWMAESNPNSHVTAVSNSHRQRQFIEAQAVRRGLSNLRVVTADVNQFEPAIGDSVQDRFDRIVSVEMFEKLRNYQELLHRISGWMKPDGKLFVHHFCHRDLCYPYETEGDENWMGRYFFSGGLMPDERLLDRFDRDLRVTQSWTWNGRNYQRTANAWLANLDANESKVLPILRSVYGQPEAQKWFQRWRIFFLSVSELFGFGAGDEWYVSHVLMEQRS